VLEPAILLMTRSYPSQRCRRAVTGCCDRAFAADFKTASLRSLLFTGVRESAIFALSEPCNVHSRSPTFAGAGVGIGVRG
jgi:hypothetical protein